MNYRVLQYQKEVLEGNKVKPLNLVHGDEEFLVKTLIEKLRSKFGENFTLVWGDELNPEELYELCSEGSMFSATADKAVVVVNFEDFLKKLGRKKKSMESLLELLRSLKTTKLFAVVGGKLGTQELSREPYRTIASSGDVILAERLPARRVKDIVRKKFEREAEGIEEDALELLVELCQGNLMVLKHESEKLIAYSEGKRVTAEDVKRVCFPWQDYTLFELIDAFFGKDVGRTLRVLKDSYMKGTSPLQILGMLSGYITKLFVVHELLSKGERLDTALEKVGVRHQFAKVKFKSYLDRVKRDRAEELLESLYRLDRSVKVNYIDPGKALENFLTEYTLR
ncbi:DNA polymerase III subunit delta [Hydrogenivirga sp.]